MSDSVKWQTCKEAGIACAGCGKMDSCTVSPDRTGFKCWRDGGRVIQTQPKAPTIGRRLARRSVSTSKPPVKQTKAYATLQAAIDAAGRLCGGTFVANWAYQNRDGSEALRVNRYALPGGGKQYRPTHVTKDGWRIGDPPGPLPLYRLNVLPAAGTIYVCEGEKAADAAVSIGLAATTSAHDSGAAEKTDWAPLAGRDVVILPDHDEPGRKYAQEVSRLLVKLDPPARVKIVELPGLPVGGDIVEFIGARKGVSHGN